MRRIIVVAAITAIIAGCGQSPTASSQPPTTFQVVYTVDISEVDGFVWMEYYHPEWGVGDGGGSGGSNLSSDTLTVPENTRIWVSAYVAEPPSADLTATIYVDGEPRWAATGSDSVYVEGWL